MQIEVVECKKQEIYDIGFINTNIIDEFLVKKDIKEAEDNVLQSLIKNQNKDTILFPYNGKWVLLSCAYSVSLITRARL